MTPEEQVKESGMKMALREAEILKSKLLAALEEAQQQAAEWEKNARTEYRIHNEVQDKNRDLRAELAEAQQTIERLGSELEEMTHDRNIWRSNSTDWEGQEELEEEEGETQP